MGGRRGARVAWRPQAGKELTTTQTLVRGLRRVLVNHTKDAKCKKISTMVVKISGWEFLNSPPKNVPIPAIRCLGRRRFK